MLEKRVVVRLGLCASLVFFTIITLFGCAAKTKIHGIKPAEISTGGIRTMGVLKFDGEYGETVRGDFYGKLGEVEHFNLVDVTQTDALDKVVYDQIDDPRFLPALEDLCADGVITGRVTVGINDIHGTDQVSMKEGTGRYEKKKNIFGKWVNVEIKRTVLRPVPYIIRQASLTTDFKVFDLKTKRIIATGKVTESYNKKFSGKKLRRLPTQDQNIHELSARVAARLVAKISPTKVSTVVKFDEGGKFGFGGHKMIKRGIEFAKRGVWEEAMEIWREVIKAEPGNAAAYYNLGVAHEGFGDLENLEIARSMYKKAARYGDKKLYIKAVARISTAIADRRKYEEQKNLLKQTPEKEPKEGGVRIY